MEFIEEQSRADELLDSLLNSPYDPRSFYFDLEADNFHHYDEVLCTVQVCVKGSFYLLDAINLDLSKQFCEILKTKKVWLHGCDYDLHLLNKHLNVAPEYLHDTQIAARLCGFRKFGYAPLVEQVCGVRLPKDSQRADWTKRPLTSKMMTYAMNDVRYLQQISDLLMVKLEKLGRVEWFHESCNALKDTARLQDEPSERWRISGSGSLQSNPLRYLKALFEWRDEQAKKIDKPVFKVANNQRLLDWANQLAEGSEIALPKNISASRKSALLDAIDKAKASPESEWPARVKRVKGSRMSIDEGELNGLISKREEVAKKLNIEGSLIASRKNLEAIVKDAAEADNLLGWQRNLLEL